MIRTSSRKFPKTTIFVLPKKASEKILQNVYLQFRGFHMLQMDRCQAKMHTQIPDR